MHVPRICVELNTISGNADKMWPRGSVITVGFMDDGSQIQSTPINVMKNVSNNKAQSDSIDPLQFTILDQYKTMPERVMAVVRERIEPLIGDIRFRFVGKHYPADVRVSFNPKKGSYSYVGTDCLKMDKSSETLNLGWFDVPTTIHEFIHVLGGVHGMNNPRGFDVDWNPLKVYQWAQTTQGWNKQTTQKNILDKYTLYKTDRVDYDPLSIMMYFFPSSLTKNHQTGYMNMKMSGPDVLWITKLYPGGRETPQSFYSKVYNQSLSSAIEESKNAANPPTFSTQDKLVFIVLACIVTLVVIGLVIYHFKV